MHFSNSLTTLAAFVLCANAAVVQFYSDTGCTAPTTERNIYDNTCATGVGGYSSWKVTTAGGGNQNLEPWNRDACAGPRADSSPASDVGTCYTLTGETDGWNGGANAMASYA